MGLGMMGSQVKNGAGLQLKARPDALSDWLGSAILYPGY